MFIEPVLFQFHGAIGWVLASHSAVKIQKAQNVGIF
jgi:hypothetical protein